MRLEPLLLLALGACGAPEPDLSPKGRVMPKRGAVWGEDLANGLGLQRWELCRELGTADCIDDAHLITLGGVEPTTLGIDEPLPHPTVSAPIAVDRVAVSACGERYARDAAGAPVIFGPVLAEDTPKARAEVAGQVIRRLLSRQPTDAEVTALAEQLYTDVAAVSTDPKRDWAVGACVVVATSTEALFY